MGSGGSKKRDGGSKVDDFAEDTDYKSEAPHVQVQLQQAESGIAAGTGSPAKKG